MKFFAFLLVFLVSCSQPIVENIGDDVSVTGADGEIVVFKSKSCGCCSGYVKELRSNGFSVKVVELDSVDDIKKKYGVPLDLSSCHTAVVDGYFIEGHVPVVAVTKLLSERPMIDGIGLAGMPAGSPGMGGVKSGVWDVYSVKDGVVGEFMKI